MSASFYWHDYETSGADPRRDRPMQFAGQRTTLDLEPIGEPLRIHCRLAEDQLVWPSAALVTGISPQQVAAEGLAEPEFAARIHAELATPETCAVGYNSLRFDDEFTRHLFWRNFYDPYAREYQHGNSRFDLIDVLRMCRALRPEGLGWPSREDGSPSFRLEDLAAANDIELHDAHDALADVRATIALARRLRLAQPRLWDWALSLRSKARVLELLDWQAMKPVIHVSARYPARQNCMAVVAPLCEHPRQSGVFIVVDLARPIAPLIELEAEELADRVFSPRDAVPEELEVPGIKLVRTNRVPMLAPLRVLDPARRAELGIEEREIAQHLNLLRRAAETVRGTVRTLFLRDAPPSEDAELALYAGLVPRSDAALFAAIRAAEPEALAGFACAFQDARLRELLFRYRARWYPYTLDAEEQRRWARFRRRKLLDDPELGGLVFGELRQQVEQLRGPYQSDPDRLRLLDAVLAWGEDCVATLPAEPNHAD